MTMNQFCCECVSRTILPALALEIYAIREALLHRDDARVLALLEATF